MSARVEAEFEGEPVSLRAVREFMAAALRVWDLDDLADVAVLLTNELVTNAVLHARSAFRVVVEYQQPDLLVEVWDDSPVVPAPARPDLVADGGRGLHLLESLAACWGVRRKGPGKAVWFRLVSPRLLLAPP